MKNILVAIGIIAIIIFVGMLIVGITVVSKVALFVVGTLAVIAVIGLIIYYAGKLRGSKNNDQ